jgi:hypothetical protein
MLAIAAAVIFAVALLFHLIGTALGPFDYVALDIIGFILLSLYLAGFGSGPGGGGGGRRYYGRRPGRG